ncbi:MAG: type II toxin-antitoxin system HipA family toxin [Pseudomonadota bacterium]|nr:MAG: type II toxin-antitoxin system HipA family toxin [Pseudomonadota bacterium]
MTQPIIQIHCDGRWIPAARIEPLADEHARVEYLPDYVFGDPDPWPVSLTLPVRLITDLGNDPRPRMPAFLYDLVPQGQGRRLLVQLLDLRDHDGLALPLLLNGAFNPIGALRIDQAVAFQADHARRNPPPAGADAGFSFRELADRKEAVVEYLATHSMLASGTTGVQGMAPKFLLTMDPEGRLHPDLALPDERAGSHWLVKGPRGRHRDDELILRNEAAYLRVAAACGLDVYAAERIEQHGRWLLLPRFDRRVTREGVQRLAQESLASLAGLQGFGVPANLNRLLEALRRHSDAPEADTREFIKRDVLNRALRNTDNHARNHAVQRRADGSIRLTPLFDFAPMYRDPELIPRALHWVDADGRNLREWPEIVAHLELDDAERRDLVQSLKQFAEQIGQLADLAANAGVDAEIIKACKPSIDAQAESLARLN